MAEFEEQNNKLPVEFIQNGWNKMPFKNIVNLISSVC